MKTNLKKFYTILLCPIFLFTTKISAQNCTVNAGIDQTICIGQPLTLSGVAGNPQSVPSLYQWTQLVGPAATITSPNTTVTTVTGFSPGNYIFELTSRCSDLKLATDIVAVTVLAVPPSAIAGPDITQCTNTAAPLNANAVTAPNVGTWTVSPVGGSFLPNANAPNATYTPPAGAVVYTLTWTISNGFCQTSDVMLLNIVAPAAVSAGTDITLSCNGNCVTMNASNPGLAPPQGGFWTQISGPNTAVITSPTLRNTTVCALVPGSYTLRWTVSGACGSGFDDVVVNVTNTFDPPAAQTAQTYSSFCSANTVTTQALNGSALTAGETAVWTQTTGGTVATFIPNNTVANVTVANLTGAFPYTFTYVRTNAAGCTASSTHTVYRNPTIQNLSNPADRDLACDATSTTFTLTYDDLPNIITGLTRTGIRITGPAAIGSVSFTSTAAATGTRTDTWTATAMTTAGTYVFRMQYLNSCGTQFRDIAITVSRTPGLVNAGSNPILPCNTLTANPIGTAVAPGNYTWTQVSGPNTATLSGINNLSLTMTGLAQGLYNMRLTISGGKTCAAKSDTMLVKVTTAAPTVATTGSDASICAGNVRLTANTALPEETGTWTVTPSAGISFLPNANTSNAIASGMAASTAYTFRWTVSNNCGSVFDEQVLTTTNVQGPPVPNAGIDLCLIAGSTTTPLTGNAPAGSTITWTALDAASSISPTNTQATTATLSGGARTYRFEYALGVAGCTTIRDTVSITVNQAITANAGADLDICAPTIPASTTLTATAPPSGTTGSWNQLTGPATTLILSPGSNSTVVNGFQPGIYEFEYRISSGSICADVTDVVVVRVVSEPSAAAAGPDQSVCNVTLATSLTLAATTPAVGTGYWQVVSGPPGSTPTFSNQLLANSTISNLVTGTYTLRWTTTNGAGCPDKTDDVVLSITATASVGADVALCNTPNANLTGNANTTGTWTFVSGPAGSTITTNSPNTAVVSGLVTLGAAPGVYTFRYSLPIIGACPATFDDIVFTNYPTPSTANAGADIELCFNTNTVILTGNVPAIGTGTWVRESGPNSPTAGTANSTFQDTTLNTIIAGIYIYQYRVNNGPACVASVDKVVILKERTAAAGTDIRVCNSSSVNLAATAGVINAGTWSYISGPAGSAFANANAPNTAVTGLVAGTYIFRWTLGSPVPLSCVVNTDDVQVIVDPVVPAMNAGSDAAFCESSLAPFQIGSALQPGVTYSWTPALFLDNTNIAQPTFSGVNNPGTYNYTVKGTIGTCEAFDAVVIKVNGKPVPAIVFSSVGCSAVTFTAANDFPGVAIATYNWNFGAGATPPTATGTGPHIVAYPFSAGIKTIVLTATTADGCVNTASKMISNICYSLPITITTFTASWMQHFTALNWQISTANNFNRFEVERSIDGITFNNIGQVMYVNNITAYSYDDMNIPVAATTIYYRLKLTDADGKFAYSTVTVVRLKGIKNEINVYPVPAVHFIKAELGAHAKGDYSLQLIDITGRIVITNLLKNAQNNQVVTLQRGNLTAGVYVLKISSSYNKQVTLVKVIFE